MTDTASELFPFEMSVSQMSVSRSLFSFSSCAIDLVPAISKTAMLSSFLSPAMKLCADTQIFQLKILLPLPNPLFVCLCIAHFFFPDFPCFCHLSSLSFH